MLDDYRNALSDVLNLPIAVTGVDAKLTFFCSIRLS